MITFSISSRDDGRPPVMKRITSGSLSSSTRLSTSSPVKRRSTRRSVSRTACIDSVSHPEASQGGRGHVAENLDEGPSGFYEAAADDPELAWPRRGRAGCCAADCLRGSDQDGLYLRGVGYSRDRLPCWAVLRKQREVGFESGQLRSPNPANVGRSPASARFQPV